MDGLLVAVRAVHYGATLVVFGELCFASITAGPLRAPSALGAPDEVHGGPAARRFRRVMVAAWIAMVASGACWLALVSLQISGRPTGDALAPGALVAVLVSTVFGRAWSLRAALALALAAILLASARRDLHRRWLVAMALACAAGLLAGLAWAGHANADVDAASIVHHAADALHLIAAGIWLGGLLPLAALLRQLGISPAAFALARCSAVVARFGDWAAGSVGVLVVTGLANAYYLVPGPRALLQTPYGNLLLIKLAVFVAMLAIAVVNRTRLTTALHAEGDAAVVRAAAAARLRRNVCIEQALGAAIVLLVAARGITPPPIRS